jgi:hypothetical protein
MSNLQNPIFQDEEKAREWLEARVSPNGPVCLHCGATSKHVTKLNGGAHPRTHAKSLTVRYS